MLTGEHGTSGAPSSGPSRWTCNRGKFGPAAAKGEILQMGASLGRVITDYRTLAETCRARADELDISRLELDRLAGLAPGYSGKLLGNGNG
jgi:hypothetical protein